MARTVFLRNDAARARAAPARHPHGRLMARAKVRVRSWSGGHPIHCVESKDNMSVDVFSRKPHRGRGTPPSFCNRCVRKSGSVCHQKASFAEKQKLCLLTLRGFSPSGTSE